MNVALQFRLCDLLIGPATCSHVDEDDVIGLVEERLTAVRSTHFGRHVDNCEFCTELFDDLEIFQGLTTHGVTMAG